MRLLVYYNPKKDYFKINYNEDRLREIELYTYNHYGHLVIQYLYVKDNKLFFNRNSYYKYLKKTYKRTHTPVRMVIGNAIMRFGRYIAHGREPKVIYVYRDRYNYRHWKDRY